MIKVVEVRKIQKKLKKNKDIIVKKDIMEK